MSNTKKFFSPLKLAIIGLMAAYVFVGTNFRIDIPTPLGKTMQHLGNVMCLLSGLLFGPLVGGLSAGSGSAMFDLFDPAYAPEAWITFINKFIMGFVAGLIAYSRGAKGDNKVQNIIAAIAGAVSYVILYIAKTFIVNYIIQSKNLDVVIPVVITKGTTSLVNGLIAVIASIIIALAIRPALKAAGIFKRL